VISEYHEDILASDDDQLHGAFEFVKSSYLNGEEITTSNQHNVHLKIKQFLNSNAEEQKLALQKELERKQNQTNKAKSALQSEKEINKDLSQDNKSLENKLKNANNQLVKDHRKKLIIYIPLAILGIFLAYLFWYHDEYLVNLFFANTNKQSQYELLTRILGSILFIIFTLPICFWFKKEEVRVWLLSFIFPISIYFIEYFQIKIFENILTYIGIGSLFAWVFNKFSNKSNK
jgi:hypothetical protein